LQLSSDGSQTPHFLVVTEPPAPDLSDPRERQGILDEALRRGRRAQRGVWASLAVLWWVAGLGAVVALGSAVAGALRR
jgi:hypothetical protein